MNKEEKQVIDVTGTPLSPGKPDECKGNGEFPEWELCCDECDYFLLCFPDWDKRNFPEE